MILKNLAILESEVSSDSQSLKAINTIKKILSNVDFKTELIPTDDKKRLDNLLIFMKGSPLTIEELHITKKLVEF